MLLVPRHSSPLHNHHHHHPGRGRSIRRSRSRIVRAAQEQPPSAAPPPSSSAAVDLLEELDGRSSEVFYGALGERGPDTLNAIICYTAKCLPCKATKPLMKEWEETLTAQGKNVRFWQFGLTLQNKDVALGLEVNSSPRFLCIRNGEVLCHMRGKAAVEEFKDFVFSNC